MHLAKPLAVSCGDPSGIGPDVILAAYANATVLNLPTFYCLGDPDQLSARAATLGLFTSIRPIAKPYETQDAFADYLPVMALSNALEETPGADNSRNAPGIIEAIDRAVANCMDGHAAGVVTAPIAKHVLYDAGFSHPGHTEYLAALAEKHTGAACQPVMMIAGPLLRTVPVTIHIPLAEVPKALTPELIEATIRITADDLKRRFRLSDPHIAVSGLNPHAGENGTIGREEIEVIIPALERCRASGLRISGPLPADTMFHEAARTAYDVAVCMYHDQALVPAKALGFDDGVNVTLGLPFVRTSPDHGTAYGLAGTGTARIDSFAASLRLAAALAAPDTF